MQISDGSCARLELVWVGQGATMESVYAQLVRCIARWAAFSLCALQSANMWSPDRSPLFDGLHDPNCSCWLTSIPKLLRTGCQNLDANAFGTSTMKAAAARFSWGPSCARAFGFNEPSLPPFQTQGKACKQIGRTRDQDGRIPCPCAVTMGWETFWKAALVHPRTGRKEQAHSRARWKGAQRDDLRHGPSISSALQCGGQPRGL